MGLIVRRNENLERMFDSFAVDPKKKAPKEPPKKDEKANSDDTKKTTGHDHKS